MLVYVSGKYSSGDVSENINKAKIVAARLWEKGHAVICPHLNTAHFEDICSVSYMDYIKGDLNMLSRCDAIVMLDGWGDSKGATVEKNYAEALKIPVFYESNLPEIHPTEIRCPEQVELFREIINRMYRVHLDKNNDYSPANILATGEVGLVTRLWDKIARLLNLTGFKFTIESAGTLESPISPKNESIEDTYYDAAVYAIIGLLLRKGAWGK